MSRSPRPFEAGVAPLPSSSKIAKEIAGGLNRSTLLGSAARADGAAGYALMAEIVYQTGPHYFAVRAAGAADPLGEGADEFGDFGVLYGRSATKDWGHASVAAGLAITASRILPRCVQWGELYYARGSDHCGSR